MFDALVRGRRRKAPPKQRRRTKTELMGMNDKDLLMELIRDIANELDVDTLCHKILLNVSTLTRWEHMSMSTVACLKSTMSPCSCVQSHQNPFIY